MSDIALQVGDIALQVGDKLHPTDAVALLGSEIAAQGDDIL